MDIARAGNKYLADLEPWKLIKTDADKTATVLHAALQVTGALSLLMEPFLPHTGKKLRDMLNIDNHQWDDHHIGNLLTEGHQLNAAALLFDKIEDPAIEAQIEKLAATKAATVATQAAEAATTENKSEPAKPETTFEEFMKMDIRIGTILEAERVPKTDKLLKLLVSTGEEKRTIVSGIAAHYAPENIIGQQVTLLANLAPRKIKGIESKGMILMAEDETGKLVFVMPSESLRDGSAVK